MTIKGIAATAVVLLAVCLFARGQATATPTHRPAVHATAPAQRGLR